MKIKLQNLIVTVLMVMGMFGGSAQTFASTAESVAITEVERLEQIATLLQVVVALQKELQIVLAEEKKEAALAINDSDYLRGSDSAKVKILTYIDFESPFSKLFHETLTQVVTENEGVAVVYRHFPLEQLFLNAKTVAIGAECVGLLGGEDAFWNFSDSVFDSRGTNEQTDISRLTEFAEDAGVLKSAFESCQKGSKVKIEVEADFQTGTTRGVMGVPDSYVYSKGVYASKISGAQPYDVVEKIVTELLK